nr:MAG TPA: Endonuclease [Caudoviricetes sp.]
MDEYTPCKKPDPTAREAIGNIMRLVRAQNRNKYNARKTTVCGHTFDSRREAEIYLDLLSRKQHGEILRIGFQPQYTLLEGFTDNQGNRQKAITYTADFFVTFADGHSEVIEVKGMRTRDYLLRKKMFLHMMRETDIIFREVR